jgi:hypothetical protein
MDNNNLITGRRITIRLVELLEDVGVDKTTIKDIVYDIMTLPECDEILKQDKIVRSRLTKKQYNNLYWYNRSL